MFRSVPTRWFELLTTREELARAVETLASTRAVELETHSGATAPLAAPDLRARLEEYAYLARRYRPYWPPARHRSGGTPALPAETLDEALARLHAWRDDAGAPVAELERLRAEGTELALLRDLLAGAGASRLDLSLFAAAGPALAARLFLLHGDVHPAQVPPAIVTRTVDVDAHRFLLALGPREEVTALDREMSVLEARRVAIPSWLAGGWRDARDQVAARSEAIEADCRRLAGAIRAIGDRHRLPQALGDIERLEWFLTHAGALPTSENFGWVTGWTSDPDGQGLRRRLEGARVHGLLRLTDPPADKRAPTVMRNPWWASPFELFARLLGTPGQAEVDPSRLLAVFVPVIFGYMFGDVGQGAVLVVLGLVLARRWPLARVLVAGGVCAIAFGFAFGSVFCREDLIAPLWLHPLEAPLPVLAVPLLGGVVILVLGLVLNGVEASWRGELASWWRTDAALLALYLLLVFSLWRVEIAVLAAIALGWYLLGAAWEHRRAARRFTSALAHLFENVLQLVVNSISFARVGAFALAHAGVSLAVVSLADATEHAGIGIAILVVGNVVVIVLEGLVVSIQTTRLVLFEFFVRFLRGEGRVFHPLAPPAPPPISSLGSSQ